MKRLCYLGILREGFSPYSSPVMLISRKLTKDKRVVTDFKHLNVRIVKNNLAYPLLKDTFSVLGSSKCFGILPYFGSALYLYLGMPMELNISLVQSFMDMVLGSFLASMGSSMTRCYGHISQLEGSCPPWLH